MQQPDLSAYTPSPAYTPSAPPPPVALGAAAATPLPERTRTTTVRPNANGADAVMLVATSVLVVSAAFLESASDATAAWLALAGVAMAVLLVARRFRAPQTSSPMTVTRRKL